MKSFNVPKKVVPSGQTMIKIRHWKGMRFSGIRGFSDPQGSNQKRKLFRTNSIVLAHSSAKKNLQ